MRKLAFCICENKDADQLRGDSEADQRLCFRYIDSTIPQLPIYEISVAVQPGLCQTWSETPKTIFLTTRLTAMLRHIWCCLFAFSRPAISKSKSFYTEVELDLVDKQI